MTIRSFEDVNFPGDSLLALAYPLGSHTTRSPERGDLGFGTIHLGYHLGLEGIRYGYPRCQMRSGFLVRRRRATCRFVPLQQAVSIRTRRALVLLDQRLMVFSRRCFARRGF